MMTTDNQAMKTRIRELLVEGSLNIYQIADKVGTSKSTVSKEKVALEGELEDGHEQSVSSLSPNLVLKMADKMAETSPAIANDLKNLAGGLQSMHRLEPRLHQAIETLVDRCEKAMEEEDLKPSDFKMYAELILKSYATALHKGATTQINVNQQQNNIENGKKYIDSLTQGIFDSPTIEGEVT